MRETREEENFKEIEGKFEKLRCFLQILFIGRLRGVGLVTGARVEASIKVGKQREVENFIFGCFQPT